MEKDKKCWTAKTLTLHLAKVLILFLLFTPNIIKGQTCVGDIILQNQAEVNSFSGCTVIDGDLTIKHSSTSQGFPIRGLAGLSNIEEVTGDLKVELTLISSFDGLQALKKVGGAFLIQNNFELRNLTGLENLSYAGQLVISRSSLLSDLKPLSNLKELDPNEGSIWISSNDLESLTGLENVKKLKGGLSIVSERQIYDLSALSNLEELGGLRLWDVSHIQQFNDLSSLKTIIGDIEIRGNPEILSLSGLENVSISPTSVKIVDNERLCSCSQITDICNFLSGNEGVIEIQRNADGCQDIDEVLETCQSGDHQVCYAPLRLSRQSQVDNFTNDFPGLTEYPSDIIISGDEIRDLTGLTILEAITGRLEVSNTSVLEDLSGLENITSVSRLTITDNLALETLEGLSALTIVSQFAPRDYKEISRNPNLTTIGLSNLTEVNSVFVIEGNNNLTSLAGFESLTYVEGLAIATNPVLTDLSGLEALKTIGNGLTPWYLGFDRFGMLVMDNTSLLSLNGIQELEEIEGGLFIVGNIKLVSLSGTGNLKTLGDGLHILNNTELENLDDLSQLETIGASFGGYDLLDQAIYIAIEIKNNAELSNLDGLSNLNNNTRSSGIGLRIEGNASLTSIRGLDNHRFKTAYNNFRIVGNPMLGDCSALSICEAANESWFNVPFIEIRGNGNGCKSIAEIKASCAVTSIEPPLSDNIAIFPNPSTETVTIRADNDLVIEVEVYNINGIRVLDLEERSTHVYDISFLNPGVYILMINTTTGSIRRNFIKK